MHKPISILAVLLSISATQLSFPMVASGQTGIAAVWINSGEDKVTRDDLRVSRDRKSVLNSVWDGTTINLFGAGGETIEFNVVIEAPGGASNVELTFNMLTGPNGSTISSGPATGNDVFNFVDRNIQLFYVRYLPIKGLSTLAYENAYDERHLPQRMRRPWTGDGSATGTWQDRPDHDKYYPDIAVPLELVHSFNIAAGQSQNVWADIFIPKAAVPGLYQGNVVVQQDGVQVRTIPVGLTVYNFTLPDRPSAMTMVYFGSADINTRYTGTPDVDPSSTAAARARLIRDRHFQLAHRHRIALIGDDPSGDCTPADQHDQPCAEWVPRLSGSLFTPANGYAGPGVGTPNDVYSIGTYGQWGWQEGTQTDMNQHANAWVTWFDHNAPGVEYFLYLLDESSRTAQMQTWAHWLRSNPGPGQRLKSLATIDLTDAAAQTPDLDIVVSAPRPHIAAQWQPLADKYTSDARERFWMYNGWRPATGSFATEDDGVALRELAWGQYKKHIQRWFYWQSTYYNNFQGGMGQTNVFENAQTFGGYDQKADTAIVGQTGTNYTNGDGVLFYPGTDLNYPADSYNVDGPFVSLRLKHWRRGLQDVDYLTLANAANPGAVQALVNQMVPKALWEYGVSDPNDPTSVRTDISWTTDPNTWEAARKQLADIIVGA